jgi:SAM-dependent methyltransferase
MNKIKDYYKNTKDAEPHSNVIKFMQINPKEGNAVDLGCGVGRDTVFLLKNGWNVLSIDKNNTEKIIAEKLNQEELKRFKFRTQKFEENKLEKNNLVVANFSIPFCNKQYFNNFWNEITNSISKDGYFVGNFLGLNDSWVNTKDKMTFLSREQIMDLLKQFEIIDFEEIEEDGKTAVGVEKHWHVFNVIAKKI